MDHIELLCIIVCCTLELVCIEHWACIDVLTRYLGLWRDYERSINYHMQNCFEVWNNRENMI